MIRIMGIIYSRIDENLLRGDKMEFRLANIGDLEELKDMYGKIVQNMNDNNIQIWANQFI